MHRRGVTLVELLVAMAVLGVLFSLVSTTLRPTRSQPPSPDLRAQLRLAQQRAANVGAPVTLTIVDAAGVHAVTVTEAGFVTGDSSLHAAAFTDTVREVTNKQEYAR